MGRKQWSKKKSCQVPCDAVTLTWNCFCTLNGTLVTYLKRETCGSIFLLDSLSTVSVSLILLIVLNQTQSLLNKHYISDKKQEIQFDLEQKCHVRVHGSSAGISSVLWSSFDGNKLEIWHGGLCWAAHLFPVKRRAIGYQRLQIMLLAIRGLWKDAEFIWAITVSAAAECLTQCWERALALCGFLVRPQSGRYKVTAH